MGKRTRLELGADERERLRLEKRELRRQCWLAIRAARAARFPGVEGRIPNFVGAEAAARQLFETDAWRRARTVKCNPDSPQRQVRRRALLEGKQLYQAVPRLHLEQPFLELDRSWIDEDECWHASSIAGAETRGRLVRLDQMDRIDLIVTGCVGASRDGARLGKGGGYSDLEYALLREAGLVNERTTIATTLHPCQWIASGGIPMLPHDQSLDLVALPDGVLECERAYRRPRGLLWSELDEERIAAIPLLATLHGRRRRRRRARKA